MENRKLEIEVKDEKSEGIYSNLVFVGSTAEEFVLDFIAVMPNMPKAQLKSRIIMTPRHAKRLMLALEKHMETYEQNFGVLDLNVQPQNSAEMPFNTNPTRPIGEPKS